MRNYDTDSSINVADHDIDRVDEYKYLGQTVKMKDCSQKEVMRRIKAGWSCFGRQRNSLWQDYTNGTEKANIQPMCATNYDICCRNMDNKIPRKQNYKRHKGQRYKYPSVKKISYCKLKTKSIYHHTVMGSQPGLSQGRLSGGSRLLRWHYQGLQSHRY